MKDIRIKERVIFSFGAQAYNALNHPNFDNPVADVPNPLFGTSVAEVARLPPACSGRSCLVRPPDPPARRILCRLGGRAQEKTSKEGGNNFAG
jgi:hypothetical protein